jgi:hypothetical protein
MMVGPFDPTLADSTFPKMPYNKLLNLDELTTGFIWRYVKNEKIIFSNSYHNLFDILMFPNTKLEDYGTDGTISWIKFLVTPPFSLELDGYYQDYMSIIINDNMSELLQFRVNASCRIRI